MSRKRKWWLLGFGLAAAVTLAGILIAASVYARRIQPYIRQQAIQYLSQRFDSDVTLTALHVSLPGMSPLRLMFTQGRGSLVWIDGGGLALRHKGRTDVPPLFAIRKFSFAVDLGTLFDASKVVPTVTLEGLEINIPPKSERPRFSSPPDERAERAAGSKSRVLIQYVSAKDATLVMWPLERDKIPLKFAIHDLKLTSAGADAAMKYHALLKNPKPPGEIHSYGTFGPWQAVEPGDTPLSGDYVFDHADLGVFVGIAGILKSTGRFEGQLNSITARGEATVPDFRLKRSGNRVPLVTKFEALIDGTNGNTTLKPVVATLGSTHFTTSGAVFKNDGDKHRQIRLDVIMPNGDMRDILRLAMKGAPFMEGRLFLKTKLDLPPLNGKVKDKLRLDGRFEIHEGKFLRSTIQDQIDGLSRRGQGQPKNQEIDEVVSSMTGAFKLDDAVVTFSDLAFGVPGADVSLNGSYNMDGDTLNFHGALKLQAKVSQTMSGWKHWLLKPVDPFFAKNGAGTFLRIKVVGSSKAPKFGAGS